MCETDSPACFAAFLGRIKDSVILATSQLELLIVDDCSKKSYHTCVHKEKAVLMHYMSNYNSFVVSGY